MDTTDNTPPTTVYVSPHTYTIDTSEDTALRLQADQNRGQCFKDINLIELDTTLPDTQQAETLIHEILHAIWHTTGLDDETDEETAVTALAPRLLSLLRENHVLTEYLTGREFAPTQPTLSLDPELARRLRKRYGKTKLWDEDGGIPPYTINTDHTTGTDRTPPITNATITDGYPNEGPDDIDRILNGQPT